MGSPRGGLGAETASIRHVVSGDEYVLQVPRPPSKGAIDGAFAHLLWNGGKLLAEYLGREPGVVRGKRVVELGCATALPSLVSLRMGCAFCCLADLPRPELLEVVRANVVANAGTFGSGAYEVRGYQFNVFSPKALTMPAAEYDETYREAPKVWPTRGPSGSTIASSIVRQVRRRVSKPASSSRGALAYDVALVADMIYLHSLHSQLLETLSSVLRPGGVAFLTFMHRFEGKEDDDLKFFELARPWFHVSKLEARDAPREQAVGSQPVGTLAPVFLYQMTKRAGSLDELASAEGALS